MIKIKSPLVVGYKGEIGSFILQGLLKIMPKALNIWCYDVNEIRSEQVERIERSDIIFLCIPMEETIKWFELNKGLLRGKIIFEQCSLKEEICLKIKELEKEWGFTLVSMHILFRPSITSDIKDRKVLIVGENNYLKYRDLITKLINVNGYDGVSKIENYKIHDEMMAFHQALVHRVLLILNKMLVSKEGTTFISKNIKRLAMRIKSGEPKLYAAIQKSKYLPKILEDFNKHLLNFDIREEM